MPESMFSSQPTGQVPSRPAGMRIFRRLGSSRLTPMRARPIFATHQDLEARVAQESFRQNLLYRIDVVRITVPPLRERPEDIPFAG